MICICATGKYLAERRLTQTLNEIENFDPIDIWYLNEILINRRKAWVFMNDWSHYSFIKIGMLANDEKRLYEHFMNGLILSMKEEEINKETISRFVRNGESVGIMKSSNLSKTASLSDLCKRYKHDIQYSGKSIGEIIHNMNSMPHGGINMGIPLKIIKQTNV